jgi:5-methylcytosine-specific restriction endonuclease McrA
MRDRTAYMKKWRAENRDKVRAADNARHRRDRDKRNAKKRERYRHAPEAQIARSAEWAAEHPEKRSEYSAARRARNPGSNRLHAANYRARVAEAFVEPVDPQIVWERDEGVCGICGKPADRDDFHVDHVIPLSKGGEHSYANVQVAHPVCNVRKLNRV